MLPDLPNLKSELLTCLLELMRSRQQESLGAFKNCQVKAYFEGSQHGIERPSGEIEINPFFKLSAEIMLEPHKDDLGIVVSKMFAMAEKMAEDFQKQAFLHIAEISEKYGQIIDGRGKDLQDAIVDLIDKVDIPLGENGKLDMSGMQFVVAPEMAAVLAKLDESPELKARVDLILEKKEISARARETNRELVG